VTIPEIAARVILIGFTVFVVTYALIVTAWRVLPGPLRDCQDDDRALLAYLKTGSWDLTSAEIGSAARLRAGRLRAALPRLENHSLIEGYWQAGHNLRMRRYVLTNLGRDRVLDLEYARRAELGKSSG